MGVPTPKHNNGAKPQFATLTLSLSRRAGEGTVRKPCTGPLVLFVAESRSVI
jgi:hypothetical protein